MIKGTTALSAAAMAIVVSLSTSITHACQIHESTLGFEPNVIEASSSLATADRLALLDFAALTVSDPAIVNWKQNTTGLTGSSPNATINAYVSTIPADVQAVSYTGTNVYVRASGVPSHPVGPFADGNPSVPSNRNRVFRIARTPQPQAGAKTATGLGAIGVMVNGVPLYNAADARSYQNQNVWHQNANVAEAAGFDTGPGHPSPIMGTSNPVQGAYHYHQRPTALLEQIDPGNTGQHHSPIIGYAIDGYPIYGPYGYDNPDGTGGITRIISGYEKRNITTRTTLPDGSAAASAGPAVSAQFPVGYYLEDFAFTGLGDLDQYNGRFTITPEYPSGTYAYFATLDATGAAGYPYLVGSSYYGVVDTGNLGGGTITIPADAVVYSVPEPAGALLLMGFSAMLLRRGTRGTRKTD